MSLRKCGECGNEISNSASACPKCGAVPPEKKNIARATSVTRVILMVVGILLIAPSFLAGGWFGLIIPALVILIALGLK